MMLRFVMPSGGDLALLVGGSLGGLLVVVLLVVLLVRAVRTGPVLGRTDRRARLGRTVAWVRLRGGRYRLNDYGVAQEFTGTPFVRDRRSIASVRAWLRVRGRPVEVMEYQYTGPRPVSDPGHGETTYLAQVVVMRGAARRMPAEVRREMAVDRELRTVTLHVDRDDLVGWRGGTLIPESVEWQVGVMADYLDQFR